VCVCVRVCVHMVCVCMYEMREEREERGERERRFVCRPGYNLMFKTFRHLQKKKSKLCQTESKDKKVCVGKQALHVISISICI